MMKGRQIEYTRSDDSSKRWINEFRTKTISVPGKLENIQGSVNNMHCLNPVTSEKFHTIDMSYFQNELL